MAADLHCHTKLSDGSVGIEDLIVIAQKKRYRYYCHNRSRLPCRYSKRSGYRQTLWCNGYTGCRNFGI